MFKEKKYKSDLQVSRWSSSSIHSAVEIETDSEPGNSSVFVCQSEDKCCFFLEYLKLQKYFPFPFPPWQPGASCRSTDSRQADRSRPCHGAEGSPGGRTEGSEPGARGWPRGAGCCPQYRGNPPGGDRGWSYPWWCDVTLTYSLQVWSTPRVRLHRSWLSYF